MLSVEARTGAVHIASGLGNDKTSQFPDLVRALKTFARRLKASVILEGEIVAVNDAGQPVGFEALQGRIHLTGVLASLALAAYPRVMVVYHVFTELKQERRLDTSRVFLYKGKPIRRINTAFKSARRRAGIQLTHA